ncbi:BlaI/MecI/CopY family transcriptional regulator [Jiangella sp. DSM 45060]|uniref:BlaI/MecI/CopY family transcriptional regulator n=1 Tax=Jiangella sp. DSM 45060 TaxID=1798224 RepID=UPI00087B1DB0|nr:BlaI/MecI/CopY family transcriptional regulator [Jiangella sp. DSM 45060]SDT18509.1 Predicted transcriptional regulator [Jiangella sp. DSM 45060]
MAGQRRRASGELELDVLRVLWSNDVPLTAKEIQDVFAEPVPAYTTILTTLERLRAKGDVVRAGEGSRGFRFTAAHSESEHTSRVMLSQLATSTDRSAALLKFAGNLDARDVDLLRDALTPRRARRRSD